MLYKVVIRRKQQCSVCKDTVAKFRTQTGEYVCCACLYQMIKE